MGCKSSSEIGDPGTENKAYKNAFKPTLKVAWLIFADPHDETPGEPEALVADETISSPRIKTRSDGMPVSKESDVNTAIGLLNFDKVYTTGGENQEEADVNDMHMTHAKISEHMETAAASG